jgi:CheY-like chemotaxis protein
MSGNLWIESPSTLSTGPDRPGTKYTFTLEVATLNNIKEHLVFKDIHRTADINCLVLTQEKELENNQLQVFVDLGLTLKFLVYRPENTGSLLELVAEKLPSLHILVIVNSATQDGFPVAEKLACKGLAENQVSILLSSVKVSDGHSLSRKAGMDHYVGVPFEPSRILEILTEHFPELSKEDLGKIPGPDKIDPNIKVLLAEDNIFNRKLMQGMFKKLGIEIDLAENGRQAVEMVRKKNYDFIFMDLLMPEMDGLQAAVEIRKLGLTQPVIALTADENPDTRKAALENGFDEYLVKPADPESLRKILLSNRSKTS